MVDISKHINSSMATDKYNEIKTRFYQNLIELVRNLHQELNGIGTCVTHSRLPYYFPHSAETRNFSDNFDCDVQEPNLEIPRLANPKVHLHYDVRKMKAQPSVANKQQ